MDGWVFYSKNFVESAWSFIHITLNRFAGRAWENGGGPFYGDTKNLRTVRPTIIFLSRMRTGTMPSGHLRWMKENALPLVSELKYRGRPPGKNIFPAPPFYTIACKSLRALLSCCLMVRSGIPQTGRLWKICFLV